VSHAVSCDGTLRSSGACQGHATLPLAKSISGQHCPTESQIRSNTLRTSTPRGLQHGHTAEVVTNSAATITCMAYLLLLYPLSDVRATAQARPLGPRLSPRFSIDANEGHDSSLITSEVARSSEAKLAVGEPSSLQEVKESPCHAARHGSADIVRLV
jgi:hypothetical protein